MTPIRRLRESFYGSDATENIASPAEAPAAEEPAADAAAGDSPVHKIEPCLKRDLFKGSGAKAGKPYGRRPWHVVRGIFGCLLKDGRDLLLR